MLCEKTLLADLENTKEQVNTTMLEVFHALKFENTQENIFWHWENDSNVNREQVQTTTIFSAPKFLLPVPT